MKVKINNSVKLYKKKYNEKKKQHIKKLSRKKKYKLRNNNSFYSKFDRISNKSKYNDEDSEDGEDSKDSDEDDNDNYTKHYKKRNYKKLTKYWTKKNSKIYRKKHSNKIRFKLSPRRLTRTQRLKSRTIKMKPYGKIYFVGGGVDMYGGKKLGQGASGCVLTPPVPCNESKQTSKNISKIIELNGENRLEDIENEINISDKLRSIDKHGYHFAIIKTYCKLRKNIIRKDIIYIDDKKKSKYKDKCTINKNRNYINLIQNNAGINLDNLLNSNVLHHAEKIIIYNQFRGVIKHLFIGLKKMHKLHIIHGDIKPNNMAVLKENNHVNILYFDYGLSIDMSDVDMNSYNHIGVFGTPGYIAPEKYVVSHILKFAKKYHISKLKEKENALTLIRKINNIIENNEIDIHSIDIKINKSVLGISKSIGDDEHDIISNENIENIFYDIINDIKEERLIKSFYEPVNGFLYKEDVYALGMTIYQIYDRFKIKHNPAFLNLVANMIEPEPKKRFNIIQCLKHPFTNHNE